jgi:hypothetical protein
MASGAGSAAGRDAYFALKSALTRQYPGVVPNIEDLERDPNSREARDRLEAALRDLNAGNDKALQQLAERLMHTIEDGVSGDPVDRLKRATGFKQLQEVLGVHLQRIAWIQDNYSVNSADLLSSRISRAPDIPGHVRDDVRALHSQLRQIIEHYAVQLESGKHGDAENLVRSLPGRIMQERAVRLVQADKNLHISYETLHLTIKYFGDFNTALLEEIEHESSAKRQVQMMFGNAVMLYELADYVISFIQNFTPGGLRDLEDLHQEALRRVETTREDQQRLTEQVNRDGINPGLRDGVLRDIHGREEALTALQEEWGRYLAEAQELYAPVGEIRQMIPNLEVIKENARVHIQVLEMVSMLRFLRESTNSIRATANILKGFRLARLDASRVRRLLELQD